MHYMRLRRHGDLNASHRERRAKSDREIALAEQRAQKPRWPESDRTCNKCGETKPVEQFAKRGGNIRKTCQDCKAEQHRQWRARNAERVKEWHRQYNQNPERKESNRDRQRHYYHEKELSERRYARQLRESYGLPLEEYQRMLAAQGGVCAVCKRTCNSGRRLSVDHDHKTGRIRGLLCGKCNRAIGYLDDNPELVRAVLNYLETSPDG